MARLLGPLCLGLLGAAAAGGASPRDGRDAATPAQLLAESGGIKWSSCADAAVSALFGLEGVHFDAGLLQVTARGVLAKEVTGGNITMGLVLGRAPADATLWERTKRRLGFALRKRASTEDFCMQRQRAGLPCRAAPGQQELRFGLASLPATVVAGEIKMRVQATDQEGRQFLCLQGSLDIKRSLRGGIIRTLSTASSELPFGPCLYGSKWKGDAEPFWRCLIQQEWKAKRKTDMNPAECITIPGANWDQANFDADGNGCKFAKADDCEKAGFTVTKISCAQEFQEKQPQYVELASGKTCAAVMLGGRPLDNYVPDMAKECCLDQESVCKLNGKPYNFKGLTSGGGSNAGGVPAVSAAGHAESVAVGVLCAAAASALA